ncbi:signal peptidase II [Micrococcus flavus]|uniref:Lipoprotein signal peptidase n=1 Tax=Micrococcus flavus TaxID=384602 RepID=A0A7W7L2K4_9MICC|nr:signal peptidase II [Micrococcus flavus]GGK37818.1 lipoprotein signal peptidase [Micrococcus flavus]
MSAAAAPEDAARPTPPDRRTGVRRVVLSGLALATLAYLLDQGTKLWVERTMVLGESIEVVPGLLRWFYILNPGAAFSIGTDVTWVFTLVQAVVAVVALVGLLRARSWGWGLALGGLLGGVLGNLTDRLFRPPSFGQGHVVDMISVPHFAVFNVADSFIVCSIVGLCLLMVTGRNLDGTRDDAAGRV